MFDIGFIELVICAIIALLVLGPERLPVAARTAGRWVGSARRMVSQFTTELDRQLKADELRKELRKAGDIGLEDVEKSVRGALDEAKEYEKMILSDKDTGKARSAPAKRRMADTAGDSSEITAKDDATADDRQRTRDWQPPEAGHDPHAVIRKDQQPPASPSHGSDDGNGETPNDKPERHS
ncbi:Sec-independent protein translocase protein TatB [Marinobacter bryozoorum]|jgi:sec-independent protein translocase protein TatB|uniref:Sec-independent protein translocase protein TatB n=1 Tax=Marinobacter bryozoorum TaxID=256324 RepID=UPI002003056B|nr:Sec-independent protein translocase protein TatB [Marinobacter bryozoorum]MCK7543973.1 Sec-independent protein translocase protein TatB [Marinobacter bryozoorum]